MDVERIQKINNLALDLMKQGLAPDREAAIQQAEQVFRNRDSDNYTEIRERMDEVKTDFSPHTKDKEVVDLSQNQIKDILQQNSTFLVKKIKEFQEKISSLEREISQLRTQMTYQKLPTVKEVISQKEEVREEPKLGEVKTSTPEGNHPRSGNYNDTDVSIEKFFYMGSK
ncbi:MAG: hypothetical protein KKH52_01505 [Nanoarchaeota archaeon]|nr:hypothetical protein [Nanoarchaeota archaeon]MBU1622748.1 hypothetical protein [Nanoarchaeota archaeon]MBU1974051.1 hypothetical protein [Nanoarchaeota archaeon]